MFWRRRSSTKEKDYEKLLADIDLEIRKIEDKLRQIKIREDRSIITWLYYSIPVYSFILIGYCFYLYQSYNPWPVLFIQAFPLLVGLFLIIFIKKFISIWYKKKTNERRG
jgi:dipeptide/tripeptide permease